MIYERIKDFREDKNLTQTQMGKILGMSQTGYSKYETGSIDIPTQILKNLALYHNTSIDYLLGLTDEKTPYPRSKEKR